MASSYSWLPLRNTGTSDATDVSTTGWVNDLQDPLCLTILLLRTCRPQCDQPTTRRGRPFDGRPSNAGANPKCYWSAHERPKVEYLVADATANDLNDAAELEAFLNQKAQQGLRILMPRPVGYNTGGSKISRWRIGED